MAELTARLSEEDQRSAVWKRIEVILNERLDSHRKKNDSDKSQDATNKLRGRIEEVKAILNLGQPEKTVPADHDPD